MKEGGIIGAMRSQMVCTCKRKKRKKGKIRVVIKDPVYAPPKDMKENMPLQAGM
jgi:hypothetical protein